MEKFYHISPNARLEQLKQSGKITGEQYKLLKNTLKPEQLDICNKLSENVISGLFLPLAIVPDVIIDKKSKMIPMVTEESSVVAAINNVAKILRDKGEISTHGCDNIGIGQIHIPKISDLENFNNKVIINSKKWKSLAHNSILKSMRKRGGGIIKIEPRILGNMGVIQLYINTCNAMGANIINQTLEQLAPILSDDLQEEVGIKILSNFNNQSITKANLQLELSFEEAERIISANEFAKIDPYRACTHNKGIMNGIDAILLATGNDWRAANSSIHVYASQNGYKSLTNWEYQGGILKGYLEIPINVGICGGATKAHPIAKCCIDILKVNSASELARICAAIGLMQNLAALLALTKNGICKGHMELHIKNILSEMKINPSEYNLIEKKMLDRIKNGLPISISSAESELKKIRNS